MDASTLHAAMQPNLTAQRAAQLVDGANDCLRRCQCTTVDRAAMLLAQVGYESVGLTASTEFASGEAYEGRKDLGNTQPGDGPRFKGRGFIQVTGRANYGALSAWGHDHGICPTPTHFVNSPTDLATDKYAWTSVIWFWTVARNMNPFADARDIKGATLAINGALHGLDGRTNRWHQCLALGEAILPTGKDWLSMASIDDVKNALRQVLAGENTLLTDADIAKIKNLVHDTVMQILADDTHPFVRQSVQEALGDPTHPFVRNAVKAAIDDKSAELVAAFVAATPPAQHSP